MNQLKAQLQTKVLSSTILDTEDTISSPIAQVGQSIKGIIFPDEFDGTALTFNGCDTVDGTFLPVNDSNGDPFTFVVAKNTVLGLTDAEAEILAAIPYIELVSGTSQSSGNAVLKVLMRSVG